MDQLYADLKKARAADKKAPGALAAHMAAARDGWAAVLDRAPDRLAVLKWAGRVRASPVLRWLHEISPLTAAEINAAKLVSAFVRACDVETAEWLCGLGGELTPTQHTMKAIIGHPDAARALATAEWAVEHAADGRGAFRASLKWAVQSGRIPLARLFADYGDRDVLYVWYATESGSVEMLRWANGWQPVDWTMFPFHQLGKHGTPQMAAYVMEQMGEGAVRNAIPDILGEVLARGPVDLAVWLRETFPAFCNEESIRNMQFEDDLDFHTILGLVLARDNPLPIMNWLEEVCNLQDADFGPHTPENIVQGDKSIATLRECLERYGRYDNRILDDVVAAALPNRWACGKKRRLARVRWLIANYLPIPAHWSVATLRAVSQTRERLQLTRELHELAPVVLDRLDSYTVKCVYISQDPAYIRWFHDEIGLTLDRARASFAEDEWSGCCLLAPGGTYHESPQERFMRYLALLEELGEITLADWTAYGHQPIKNASFRGWAQVLARARDAGVTAADVHPILSECVSRRGQLKTSLDALAEVFGFSCRELRRVALCQLRTKKEMEILVAEYGASIEDLRADDYSVLRHNVERLCGTVQIRLLSQLGITSEDAAAVMDSLGEQPFEWWGSARWASTRGALRRIARRPPR